MAAGQHDGTTFRAVAEHHVVLVAAIDRGHEESQHPQRLSCARSVYASRDAVNIRPPIPLNASINVDRRPFEQQGISARSDATSDGAAFIDFGSRARS